MNPWIWLAILLVDYQLIVYGKIDVHVIVYVTLFQTWISTYERKSTQLCLVDYLLVENSGS